jgi:cytochrome c biogenesis protein CcmG, thiol:disulfide interchange protein DsbE
MIAPLYLYSRLYLALLLAAATTATGASLKPGDRAPAWDWAAFAADTTAAKPLNNKHLNSKRLKDKVVLLNFWATWCAPCRQELPQLDSLQRTYADSGLVVIGVNLDKRRDRVDAFIKRTKVRSLVVLFDPGGDLASRYDPAGLPTSYLIGRNGVIHATYLGLPDGGIDRFEADVRALLDQEDSQ